MEQEKDIVERLRDPAYPPTPAGDMALRLSAADEINRLRGRLDRARQQIGHLMAIRDAQAAVLGQGRGSVIRPIKQYSDTTGEKWK